MIYQFPKSLRLRTRREYRCATQGSQKYIGQWVILDIRQGKGPTPKLGITVTRRYGKAHQRNRFKRIVREAFRLSYHTFPTALEIHVRPRSAAAKATMQEIQQEILEFIVKNRPLA